MCVHHRFNVCIITNLAKCGPNAAAPASPILLPAQKNPHAGHTSFTYSHQHYYHSYQHCNDTMYATTHSYSQGSTSACLPTCPGVDPTLQFPQHQCCSLPKQTTHTTPKSLPPNTPPTHQAPQCCVRLRFSISKFSNLAKCGPNAAAPVSPIMLPAHAPHIQVTPANFHNTSREATTLAYLQDLTSASSPTSPSVDPLLPTVLHQHRTLA